MYTCMQTTSAECNSLKELVLSLQGQLAEESQARRQSESQSLQDKRESDMKLREAIGQIEKANHSYQMVWNMKTGLEEKHNKNSEQKKILVKEVKHLRKRIEESDDINDQMSLVNDKLIAVTSDLRQQVELQRRKIESQNAAMLASTDITLHDVMRTTSSDNLNTLVETNSEGGDGTTENVTDSADKLLLEAAALTQRSAQVHSKDSSSHGGTPTSTHQSSKGTNVSEGVSHIDVDNILDESAHQSVGSGSGTQNSPADIISRGGGTASVEWDFPTETSSSSLLNMDWLSPEQKQLAAQRHQNKQQLAGNDLSQGGGDLPPRKSEKRSSIAMFKNAISGLSMPKDFDFDISFHGSSHSSEHEGESSQSVPTSQPSPQVPSETKTDNKPTTTSSEDRPNAFIDASYVNGGKPTCFRCGGTVEGPKYSTCKCAIPAMSPLHEDENDKEDHGIQAIKGFFKKGTSKAGDFASVARRKSLAVGMELFHHKENAPTESAPPPSEQHGGSSGIHFPHLFSSNENESTESSGKKHTLVELDHDGDEDGQQQQDNVEKEGKTSGAPLLDL